MSGERQLDARSEKAHLAALRVVDEHRLAEPELGGDPLSISLGHLCPIEEHAERIAPVSVRAAEDRDDVELGHRLGPSRRA